MIWGVLAVSDVAPGSPPKKFELELRGADWLAALAQRHSHVIAVKQSKYLLQECLLRVFDNTLYLGFYFWGFFAGKGNSCV